MPIDPRIPLGVQAPQIDSPAQTLAQIGQLRNMQQAGQMNQLQIEAAQQQQAAAARAAQEEAALRQLFTGERPPSIGEIVQIVGPTRGTEIYKGMQALRDADLKSETDLRAFTAATIGAVLAVPEGLRQDAYNTARQRAIELGVNPAAIPEEATPETIAMLQRWGMSPEKQHEIDNPPDYTLTPGGQRRSGASNEVIAEVPTKPPEPPAVGSFEDYLVRYAAEKRRPVQTLSPKDIEDARRRYAQADNAPSQPRTEMTPGQAFNATRQLRNDYNRETAAAREMRRQFDLMEASLQSAMSGGGLNPASQGILVTFQKVLDPDSVVRESEYARSPNGLALIDRIRGAGQRIVDGGPGVPPEKLKEFVDLAREFTRRQLTSAQETRRQIDGIAKEYGLDPGFITRDIPGVDEAPKSESGQPPPTQGGPSGGVPSYQDYLRSRGQR